MLGHKDKKFDFSKLFEGDVDDKELKATKAKLDAIGEAARKCLNTSAFEHYRTQYERALNGIMDAMVRYTNSYFAKEDSDAVKYAMAMACYVTKIQNLRILLKQVELDAKKGLNQQQGEDDGEEE